MSDSFETPWAIAHQALLSMGSPRQEYWSGLPFLSPMHARMLSRFSCVRLCDPIAGRPPGSPVPEILRQEYWSGLPFPSPMHARMLSRFSRV